MPTEILQPTHLLLILVVALLVLGPKRLPEVGRKLGDGLRDFRNAINGERDTFRDAIKFDAEPRHPVVEESFSYGDHDATAEAAAEPQPAANSGGTSSGGTQTENPAGVGHPPAGRGSERPDAA